MPYTYVEQAQPEPPRRKSKIGAIIIGISLAVILACCGGALVLQAGSDNGERKTGSGVVTPSPTPPPPSDAGKRPAKSKASPTVEAAVTINEGYAGRAGDDFPAGTYRTVDEVGGMCYWLKSRDAEGQQIIDNNIPTGGRPEVTIKSGQYFTTTGCGVWRKK